MAQYWQTTEPKQVIILAYTVIEVVTNIAIITMPIVTSVGCQLAKAFDCIIEGPAASSNDLKMEEACTITISIIATAHIEASSHITIGFAFFIYFIINS